MLKSRENKNFIREGGIIYTLLFISIFYFGFRDFLLNKGFSFVWHNDGATQHVPYLYDLAQMLKQYVSDPTLGFPLWSWDIGLGADIIQSYAYYVLGDPLSLIAAMVVSLEKIEITYNFLVIFRLYLTGIAFIIYCRFLNIKTIPAVTGALIYTFSVHLLFWGIRHPFFTNPAILLPLLFIAVEKVLRGEKPYLFIILIGLSAVSNFYFFYMNTLAVFIYAVIRFFYYYKENRFKIFIRLFLKTTLWYSIGLCMAGIIFIPSVYGVIQTVRVMDYDISFKPFSLNYYNGMLERFLYFGLGGGIPNFTVAGLALPGTLYILFTKKRERSSFKILYITLSLFMGMPFFYSLFSGLSAPLFRWLYIYSFFAALVTTMFLDDREKTSEEKITALLILSFIYSLWFFLGANHLSIKMRLLPIVCFTLPLLSMRIYCKERRKNLIDGIILLTVSINLIFNIQMLMTEKYYGSDFIPYNTMMNKYKNSVTANHKERLRDGSFYRIGFNQKAVDAFGNNQSVVNDFKGTYLFNSIINGDLMNFFYDNNLRTTVDQMGFEGVDNITALESILGVKYYMLKADEQSTVPYGFKLDQSSEHIKVYKNENSLPVGFVYEHMVNKEVLEKLNPVERIYLMLQAGIVENGESTIPFEKPEAKKVDFEIVGSKHVIFEDNRIIVEEPGGEIYLKAKDIENAELYLSFSKLKKKNQGSYNIRSIVGDTTKIEYVRGIGHQYYLENTNILINLGFYESFDERITVRISERGLYYFEELNLYQINMAAIDPMIRDLKSRSLQNIDYDHSYVKGDIELDKEGILFLSIPYSEGWKAYVDGKKVETLKVNTGFIGIRLHQGVHKIEMRYETPFLKTGIRISIIGALILLCMMILDKKTVTPV